MIEHQCKHFMPEFLCRACHPELTMPEEKRRALDEADRQRQAKVEAERSRLRELDRTKRKIASMTKHYEPLSDTVAGRIVASLRRKAERLECGPGELV